MLAFFSDGFGLKLLIALLLLSLFGIGFAVCRSGKKEYLGNILLPCGLIALSILFFAITFSFPEEDVGPDAVPNLWIFWTILLSLVILYQIRRGTVAPDPELGRVSFLIMIIGLLVAYYFAMQIAGYFLSTFLFLVLLMHILSYRKKLIIYLVAGGWVVFSYVVFYKILFIQLPLGYFEYFY